MKCYLGLAALALRPVLDAAGEAVGIGKVGAMVANPIIDHLVDHGTRVETALRKATERSWDAVEVVLAGQTILARFDRTETREFRRQVEAFLEANPPTDFNREACLEELRSARAAGLLTGTGSETARFGEDFARYSDPSTAPIHEQKLIEGLASDLPSHPNLARFLALRPGGGPPLVVVAVRYFFRREVEKDEVLARGLTFSQIDGLTTAQRAGFDAMLSNARAFETVLSEVRAVTIETRDAVLDLRGEIQGQGEQIRHIGVAVQKLLEQHQLGNREVRVGDSFSVRTDAERMLVKQLVSRYRGLPESDRQRFPALLDAIGKLEVATGDFAAAQDDFRAAAALTDDLRAKAECHHNAYLAALERREFAEAFREFLTAVELDGRRFAPFPIDRYRPRRILGAGGFGIVFLCQHRDMDCDIVVKALRFEGRDAETGSAFAEAQAVRKIDHPNVIRLTDCGWADPSSQSRPYLVMDYVPGETLEDLVVDRGPLPESAAIPLLRQVASGLAAAHSANVLHRDLKPANVLTQKNPLGGWHVRVIDFGLAVWQPVSDPRGEASTARTRNSRTASSSGIAGTVDYGAPEQMGKRSEPVGPYTDVFGWGKTACFTVFGTTQPLPSHWRTASDGLGRLIERCLSENPVQRPQSFSEVLAELDRIDAPPPPSTRNAIPSKLGSRTADHRSNPLPWIVGGLVAFGFFVLLLAWQLIGTSKEVVPIAENKAASEPPPTSMPGTSPTTPKSLDPPIVLPKMPNGLEGQFGPIRLETIPLRDGPGDRTPILGIRGIRPVGPGVDVVWTANAVYAMSEPGRMKEVYATSASGESVGHVVADGRYVWISTSSQRVPNSLVLLDPLNGKATAVGIDSGLPRASERFAARFPAKIETRIAAIGPGRVCLVGVGEPGSYVGGATAMTWIAIAAVDPKTGKPIVQVVHRSYDQQDSTDPEQWRKTSVEFLPAAVYVVDSTDHGRPRAILHRGGSLNYQASANEAVATHPLAVDPDTGKVTVVAGVVPKAIEGVGQPIHDGAAYFLGNSEKGFPRLARFVYSKGVQPNVSRELAMESELGVSAYPPIVAFLDDRVHVVQRPPEVLGVGPSNWAMGSGDGADTEVIATNLPMVYDVNRSVHYGLVAIVGSSKGSRGTDAVLSRVEIVGCKPLLPPKFEPLLALPKLPLPKIVDPYPTTQQLLVEDAPPLVAPPGEAPEMGPPEKFGGVTLRTVTFVGGSGAGVPVTNLRGVLAAGPGLDVYWQDRKLYLMRTKGRLLEVASIPDANERIGGVVFDGRYLWVRTFLGPARPHLFVVDSASGRSRTVTPEDGLPEITDNDLRSWNRGAFMIDVGPIDDGRVCITGTAIGYSWIAIGSVDRKSGLPKIRVVHRATESAGKPGKPDASAVHNIRVGSNFWRPFPMGRVRPDGGKETTVVIPRGFGAAPGLEVNVPGASPLLLDPDTEKVAACEETVHHGPTPRGQPFKDGAAYYIRANAPNNPYLARHKWHGEMSQRVSQDLAGLENDSEATVVFDGKRVHAIGYSGMPSPRNPNPPRSASLWATGTGDGSDLRVVGTGLPPMLTACRTSHYGLVVISGDLNISDCRVVEVAAP